LNGLFWDVLGPGKGLVPGVDGLDGKVGTLNGATVVDGLDAVLGPDKGLVDGVDVLLGPDKGLVDGVDELGPVLGPPIGLVISLIHNDIIFWNEYFDVPLVCAASV